MRKKTLERQLKHLLAAYLDAGRYTHFYAACGSLLEKKPYFEFSHLPHNQSFFDLASLTKALSTTPLVLNDLFSRGLKLSTTLGEWLLDDVGLVSQVQDLTVASLLAHESGLPAWRNLWLGGSVPISLERQCIKERLVRRFNSLSKGLQSNKPFVYSDLGFVLLGFCLEHIHKESLSRLFCRFCRDLSPSLEQGICYASMLKSKECAVPTAFCSIRQRWIQGEVHDENAWSLGGDAGHSGLFSTGPGLVSFLKALCLSSAGELLVGENKKKRTQGAAEQGLCGWRQGVGVSSKVFGAGLAIGHLGFTGTAFWVKPEQTHYAVVLTNRTISSRRATWMTSFRQEAFSLMDRICCEVF